MPANVLKPKGTKPYTILVGGSVNVQVFHEYAAPSNLACRVTYPDTTYDEVAHLANPLNGLGVVTVGVPCSKPAGTYPGTLIEAKTGGVPDGTSTFTLVVTAALRMLTVARTGAPAPPPAPGGGPIQYLVSGDIDPRTAYVVCVAHEVTADPAVLPVPVDGVFCLPQAAPPLTWAGLVTVPNRPGFAYVARVIEFDANDNILFTDTEVLM